MGSRGRWAIACRCINDGVHAGGWSGLRSVAAREDGQRAYHLWVDYSLAAYLSEALAAIAADILEAALTDRSLDLCGKRPSLNVHRALVAYQTLSGRR